MRIHHQLGRAVGIIAITVFGFACVLLGQNPSPQTTNDNPVVKAPLRLLEFNTWHVTNKAELNTASIDQVAEVIYQAIQKGPESEAKQYYTSTGPEGFVVEGYTFIDLDGDGALELVAAIDLSGRPLFNTVIIVSDRDEKRRYRMIDSSGPGHNFSQEIVDLDGDGVLEMLVKDRWSAFLPDPRLEEAFDEFGKYTLPDTAWIDIVHFVDGEIVKVSDQFSHYYQQQHGLLFQDAVTKIQRFTQSPEDDKEALISHYQIGLFKIQHLFGREDAGLAEAKVWAISNSEVLQENAVRIFADIGNEQAVSELERLSKSKSGMIAEQAEFNLKVVRARKTTPLR